MLAPSRLVVPLLAAARPRLSRHAAGVSLLADTPPPLDAAAAIAQLLQGGVTVVGAVAAFALLALSLPLGLWLYQQQYVLDLRKRRARPAQESKSKSVPPDSAAYVPPRELWTPEQLRAFDGSGADDGPILIAADGLVFNVSRARNFYGPGGEYHVMAGADASRYLARNSVESESASQAAAELNVAERASLGAWVFSLRQRYDVVGRLGSADEVAAREAAAAERTAYLDRMDELAADLEARESLEAAWMKADIDVDAIMGEAPSEGDLLS